MNVIRGPPKFWDMISIGVDFMSQSSGLYNGGLLEDGTTCILETGDFWTSPLSILKIGEFLSLSRKA